MVLKKIILDDSEWEDIVSSLALLKLYLKEKGQHIHASQIQSLKLRLKKQVEIANQREVVAIISGEEGGQ